jgi:hypothetical protein
MDLSVCEKLEHPLNVAPISRWAHFAHKHKS